MAVRGRLLGDGEDIWSFDVTRGTSMKLTFTPFNDFQPAWHPDGARITYAAGPTSDIFMISSDGSGKAQSLVTGPLSDRGPHWSPDGNYLVYYIQDTETDNRDIWYLRVDDSSKPAPLFTMSYNEALPRISPDGRYMAYQSDEDGHHEIYLTSFPTVDIKEKVSVNGGIHPRWNGKGDELFFIEDDKMMVVGVQTHPNLRLGSPRQLFTEEQLGAPLRNASSIRDFQPLYDVSSDGRRFVIVLPAGDDIGTITIVQNWIREFPSQE